MAEARNQLPIVSESIPGMGAVLVKPNKLTKLSRHLGLLVSSRQLIYCITSGFLQYEHTHMIVRYLRAQIFLRPPLRGIFTF